MITWDTARALVRAWMIAEYGEPGPDYVVADYGAEDATRWWVLHGPAAVLDGTLPIVGGLTDGATFVDKVTGCVSWRPMGEVFEVLDGMTPFGDWPA